MSYGVSFLPKRADRTWDETLDEAEKLVAGPEVILDDATRAAGERVLARALQLLPDAEVFRSETMLELSDAASGLQLLLCASEAGLSIPYWHDGEAARDVMITVRRLGRVIEDETGWVGWDPQRVAPFFEGEASDAVRELEHGTQVARNLASPKRRPWWRFW